MLSREKLAVLYKHGSVDHVRRAKSRRNLVDFTKYTKPDFQVNWHHQLLCEYLEAFAKGLYPRLIIEAPPRHGKSELVSRRLPAYIFGQRPNAKIITASYGAELASSMNRDVQRIIDSETYQKLFPNTRLSGSNTRKSAQGSWLRNSDIFEVVGHGGMYRSAGVGGPITGLGGDYLIIDDPIKNAEEADSLTHRNKVWDWYTTTFYTRLERNGSILLTLTRWHEDDLAGRLLNAMKTDRFADKWVVLTLPAIADDNLDAEDPREEGEALWPYKYDINRLLAMKGSMGSRAFNALYQQRPAPEKGNIIDTSWFRFYREHQQYEYRFMSWDCTFKDTESSDFVVGGIFGVKGGQLYLLDVIRKRMAFTETQKTIQEWCVRYPDCREVVIEDKANGTAVIDTLRKSIPMLVPVSPTESKISRANASAPFIEAGNLFLPDPINFPHADKWVKDFRHEFQSFPNGTHDDQVDMVTQAIMRFRKNATWVDALDKLESAEFDDLENRTYIQELMGWK